MQIIDSNILTFGDTHCKQTDRTAIGKNYASTYMGALERELLKKCQKKPTIFLRFVDDIFGIWEGSKES